MIPSYQIVKTPALQFFQNAWQPTWAVLDQHSLTLYEQGKKGQSKVKVSDDLVQGCYMVDQMAFINTVETSSVKSHLVICTKQNLRLEFVRIFRGGETSEITIDSNFRKRIQKTN